MGTRGNKKRGRLVQGTVVALGIAIGGAYLFWQRQQPERVAFAWIVQTESPRLVVFDEQRYDGGHYYLLRVVDARTGEPVGRLEVGNTRHRKNPRVFGPVDDRFAWVVVEGREVKLVDLDRGEVTKSHEQVRKAVGVEVRVPPGDRALDSSGRLVVSGADGRQYAVSSELEVEAVEDVEAADLYQACRPGLERLQKASTLHDASLRGCFELDGRHLGFVQHATAAFGNRTWQGSLFDDEGKRAWTIDAGSVTGTDNAWLGHAVPSENALLVTVVEPRWFTTAVHLLEIDPRTGSVRTRNEVL